MRMGAHFLNVPLEEIDSSFLADLKEMHEGWYLEYKSEPITVRKIGKSLSSFANQYGGWIIFGVIENPDTLKAERFPGLTEEDLNLVKKGLMEAARDFLEPDPFYECREFEGPIDDLGLEANRHLLVVRIPAGGEAPYIHADGRIYRRVGDSSAPKPVNDRMTLDQLTDRSEQRVRRIKELVLRTRELSESESENCYLNLFMSHDPFEVGKRRYEGTFEEISEKLTDQRDFYDNLYLSNVGFVARHVQNNDAFNRVVTWEFDRRGHSFITIPINYSDERPYRGLGSYKGLAEFDSILASDSEAHFRVIDLNYLLEAIAVVVDQVRFLLNGANIRGPFYVKMRIENVWRCVPFLDTEYYFEHLRAFGVPVVQETEMTVPYGWGLRDFIMLPEMRYTGNSTSEIFAETYARDAVRIFSRILQALGIPVAIFNERGDDYKELIELAGRYYKARGLLGESE